MDAATGSAAREESESPSPAGGLRAFTQSGTFEWYTPDFILNIVRELFVPGCIDLDPCSCAAANTRVGATSFYDERANGLAEGNAWKGNVFLNPAFGTREGRSLQGLFFAVCA